MRPVREGMYAKIGAITGILCLVLGYLGIAATERWVPFTISHSADNPAASRSPNGAVTQSQTAGTPSPRPIKASTVYAVSFAKMLCDESDGGSCLDPSNNLIGSKYIENSSITDADIYPDFADIEDIGRNTCFAATLKYGISTGNAQGSGPGYAVIRIIQNSAIIEKKTLWNNIGTVHLKVDGGPITILGSSINGASFGLFQVAGSFRCHSMSGYR